MSEPGSDLDQAVHVLGYREDGGWVALALELDLRGYGDTWEDALAELQDLVAVQVRFAGWKGLPKMAWRRAEPEYWRRFRQSCSVGASLTT